MKLIIDALPMITPLLLVIIAMLCRAVVRLTDQLNLAQLDARLWKSALQLRPEDFEKAMESRRQFLRKVHGEKGDTL